MPLSSLKSFWNACQKLHSNISRKITFNNVSADTWLDRPSILLKAKNWKPLSLTKKFLTHSIMSFTLSTLIPIFQIVPSFSPLEVLKFQSNEILQCNVIFRMSERYSFTFLIKRRAIVCFPGGAVVKKPPANARDTGSSPGPGRSHMPQSIWACAPELLSLRSRAREPQLLKPARLEPMLHNKRSHCNEKPAHRNEE